MAEGLFDQAQKVTNDASRQALAALARGGSGALAEYKAGQEQLSVQKQATATMALERAAAIGAPAAGELLAKEGSMTGRPEGGLVPAAGAIYDRYAQDSERAGTARSNALADMSRANSNYFAQIQAARPIVEGNARAKAAMQAKAVKDTTLKDLFTQYGGQENFKSAVGAQANAQADDFSERRGANGPGSAPRPFLGIAQDSATRLGLPAPASGAMAVELAKERATADKANAPKPMNQAAHRADVVARVRKSASPNTSLAFNEIAGSKSTLAAALALMDDPESFDLDQLKKDGVSRKVLERWLADYYGGA